MEDSERFKYFSPQFSMPYVLMEEIKIQLILPTIMYDLFIFLHKLSMLCLFLGDTRQICSFLHTIKYDLYIPGRHVTGFLIYTHN